MRLSIWTKYNIFLFSINIHIITDVFYVSHFYPMTQPSFLTNFRDQIDQIDSQLIELLAKRFEVVKQVGMYKKEHNIPPLQSTRWQEVLETRMQHARDIALDAEFVEDVWTRIHEHALKLEEVIR